MTPKIERLRTTIKAMLSLLDKNDISFRELQLHDLVIVTYQKYVHDKLADQLKVNDLELINSLKKFLGEHWDFIKGNMLCYTALPDHMVTKFLYQLAELVASEKQIHCLMPGICVEHLINEKEDLTELPLSTIIGTYVIDETRDYLLPISCLSRLEINDDLSRIENPYYDYTKAPSSAYLTEGDITSLTTHSEETKAIVSLKTEYENLKKEDDSLLTRLHNLINSMRKNSAHGGIGAQEVAAKGGFIGITEFFEYFEKTQDVMAEIPATKKAMLQPLLKEIEILRQHAVSEIEYKRGPDGRFLKDSQGNLIPILVEIERIDKTGIKRNVLVPKYRAINTEIGSCLGTRSEELQKNLSGHEATLAKIHLSDAKKAESLTACLRNFDTAKKTLNQLLEEKKYCGNNKLGITAKILEILKIPFVLPSIPDSTIEQLNLLTANELSEICTIKYAAQEIIRAIDSIENLVLLIIRLSSEKLFVLLPIIFDDFLSLDDWLSVLDLLTDEKIIAVCAALKSRFQNLIKNPIDFLNLIVRLPPEKITVVCNTLKDHLPGLITTARDFNEVLRGLSAEQKTVVYNALQDHLPRIVQTTKDFERLFVPDRKIGSLNLSSEQRSVVFNVLKNHLPSFVKTQADLRIVLRCLSAKQRDTIGDACKTLILTLVKEPRELDFLADVISNQLYNKLKQALLLNILKKRIENYKRHKEEKFSFFSRSSIKTERTKELLQILNLLVSEWNILESNFATAASQLLQEKCKSQKSAVHFFRTAFSRKSKLEELYHEAISILPYSKPTYSGST